MLGEKEWCGARGGNMAMTSIEEVVVWFTRELLLVSVWSREILDVGGNEKSDWGRGLSVASCG